MHAALLTKGRNTSLVGIVDMMEFLATSNPFPHTNLGGCSVSPTPNRKEKLLARFFAVLFSTASYPKPNASYLVAAEVDALCLGTFFS